MRIHGTKATVIAGVLSGENTCKSPAQKATTECIKAKTDVNSNWLVGLFAHVDF